MQQKELSAQLEQSRYVDLGVDEHGAPIRVHRFTPVRVGRSGKFEIINRATDEVVERGLDSLSAANDALTRLMPQRSAAHPTMSF